ncbi:hypothetical protein EJ05DRAFT_475819 [Pseudovirgaria hyperparasitica]|uniref:TPR-like protein n=1 Tax=Pseudovirgaria hyperparasitica TaxID=470096 RepID=A0A6A6W9G8_9PEZI|nr:uncharacterized protein EJ05DRAFT_475819 [Pseudovirgaria hyperparasitica]KAF2758516.1 hypothetical protein EJ05DRAFT_475819 [Pseudovirgaria hyperparasitica]
MALKAYFWPYHKFPDEVAAELRKAIYFHTQSWDPEKAMQYYKAALMKAQALGMNPVSDEITGTKLSVAELLKQCGLVDRCIGVYELVLKDCTNYLKDKGEEHYEDGERTRLLMKSVSISMKLGEMYASDSVLDIEAAERHLLWGVETTMKERIRRQKDGVKEGEGDWFTDEQYGASCESLALHYESKMLHYLATPLLLQALTVSPPKSCHSVVIMSNLANCIFQTTPPPSLTTAKPLPATSFKQPASTSSLPPSQDSFPTTPHPSKEVLRTQASAWARKALALSTSITEGRTQECDLGCAAATHALGEFAEAGGEFDVARKLYEEAKGRSVGLGFEEGVKNAEMGLKRIEEKSGSEEKM